MRFIRDIINEKKNEPLPQASPDMDSGLDHSSAYDGGESAWPDLLTSSTEPVVHDAAPTPPQSDEQALRDIFEANFAEETSAGTDAAHLEFQDETPEEDDPSEMVEAVPKSAEQEVNPVGEVGRDKVEPRDRPTARPVGLDDTRAPDTAPPTQPTTFEATEDTAQPVEVPQPAAGRMLGRSGRVKTRVLGFGQPQSGKANVFSNAETQTSATKPTYPVGWLVLVDGPGKGSAFTLHSGVSSIGRNPDQTVALAFGDNSISRENHAAIAYDVEQNSFFLGHGSKTNLVRLNDRPVLSTEELKSDDVIRIGETTLRFVALCGDKFSWSTDQENGVAHDTA